MSWVLDVVLDGTGSVGLIGPFRTQKRAEALQARIRNVLATNAVPEGTLMIELTELTPAEEWLQIVDITP